MNKFLIACFAASGFCGLAATAHAAPAQDAAQPINVAGVAFQQPGDMPYMLANLQNEIQMLRTEVQTLGTIEGQAPGDSHYAFSVEPPPNADGAPIPTGG